MKQRFLLSLLALVFTFAAMMPTTLAAFEPGDRYAHIATYDTYSLYYDTTKTDRDAADPNTGKPAVLTWIYWVFPKENVHTAVKTTFSAEDNTMTEYFEINYKSDTNEVISQNYTRPFLAEECKPGSVGEAIMNVLFKK